MINLNPDINRCYMVALSMPMFDSCSKHGLIQLPQSTNENNEQKEVREEIRHILEQQFSG